VFGFLQQMKRESVLQKSNKTTQESTPTQANLGSNIDKSVVEAAVK
jgi:hypothetical protein